MRTVLISYDLVGTSETSAGYERLVAAIKRLGLWAKIGKSVWIVRTTEPCARIHDMLWPHVDDSDRLFIIRTRREAAWQNVLCDDDWLQDNLQS